MFILLNKKIKIEKYTSKIDKLCIGNSLIIVFGEMNFDDVIHSKKN